MPDNQGYGTSYCASDACGAKFVSCTPDLSRWQMQKSMLCEIRGVASCISIPDAAEGHNHQQQPSRRRYLQFNVQNQVSILSYSYQALRILYQTKARGPPLSSVCETLELFLTCQSTACHTLISITSICYRTSVHSQPYSLAPKSHPLPCLAKLQRQDNWAENTIVQQRRGE
jgi:hypothetical protein